MKKKLDDAARYKNRIHPPVAYAYRRSLDNNKTRVERKRKPSETEEKIRESEESGSRKLDGRVEKLRS